MREASEKATLVDGACDLVAKLIHQGWWVGDITTCYEQYGYPITRRIGIPSQNVACTRLRLDQYRKAFRKEDLSEISQLEKDILAMRPVEDDENIKRRLDLFYWGKTANANVRAALKMVKPLGGWRKVKVLRTFTEINQVSMDQIVVVGDSITDIRMLESVNKAGGLAIAFNANEYALPYSTMSLAPTNLDDLWTPLEAWEKGGRETVEELIRDKEKAGGEDDRGWFHWLAGSKDLTRCLEIHKRIRRLVREEAAKLG